MEHKQQGKKRGRTEEDKEDWHYKNNNIKIKQQSAKNKKEKKEHCNKGKKTHQLEDSNSNSNSNSNSSSSSSNSCNENNQNHNISSENHVGLGVFDFPWMHEGIVSNSEDWNYIVENTLFSSAVEETCSGEVKFSDILSDDSVETSPTMALMNFDEYKCVFNEIESVDCNGFGLEMEGADCIWGSLLNQPLHSSTRSA